MFFFHGKLGVMDNLAGWKHDMRMHELWDYLPENSPSMNDKTIAKLDEAKFCILFCLVPRASVLHGTKERCMSVGLLHVAPWLFSFYSLQKVSGQQILEACLRSLKGFHLCLEISCSHPCFKENQIWRFKSHGSQIVLPLFYFIIFSRERYSFFSKGIYYCSPNFDLFSKTQTRLG